MLDLGKKRNLLCLFLFLTFGIVTGKCFALPATDEFHKTVSFEERFLDVRTFLLRVCKRYNLSLVISKDVRSSNKEIIGKNIEEILGNYLKPMDLDWKLFENCIYVAKKKDLDFFFENLAVMEMGIPEGKKGKTFSGEFEEIEISLLCHILKSISGLDIRPSENLKQAVMMRAVDMPWKRILVALIYLNRFRMIRTDFSVLIAPEEL
jgi:hypothetical protein